MADFPLMYGGNWPSRAAAALASPGSAHTKTAYSEVSSAYPTYTARWHQVTFSATGGIQRRLADLAWGPSGSEELYIENLLHWNDGRYESCYLFPLAIPQDRRFAWRLQSSVVTDGMDMHMMSMSHDLRAGPVPGRALTLGADTANTRGTTLTTGAGSYVWGPYVEFSAALPFTAQWICVALGSTDLSSDEILLMLATGASGSETSITNAHTFWSTPDGITPSVFSFPLSIPVGSRLAARAMSSDASARPLDVVLYLFG